MNNHPSAKKRARRVLFAMVILTMLFLLFFPIVVMLSVSLKEANDVFTNPVTIVPKVFAWKNYVEVFHKMDILNGFKNSVIDIFYFKKLHQPVDGINAVLRLNQSGNYAIISQF